MEELNSRFKELWNKFESNWNNWSFQDIAVFIIYKMEWHGTSYMVEGLAKKAEENGILGKSLPNLDETTIFKKLEIEKLKDVHKIFGFFQKVMDAYPLKELTPPNSPRLPENKFKIPPHFLCPIDGSPFPMKDPVIAADKCIYEREAIERWFKNGNETSPTKEGVPLRKYGEFLLFPNMDLKNEIAKFEKENSDDLAKYRRKLEKKRKWQRLLSGSEKQPEKVSTSQQADEDM